VTSTVYVLWHQHEIPAGEEGKLLGVYSSAENAAAAIRRLSDKPGFAEHPNSFQVVEYILDRDQWPEGFISWTENLE
jgi:hypothetical protein